MPRIHPKILHQARAISSSLVQLLPICRDLPSARNELRWLDEHARYIARQLDHRVQRRSLLRNFIRRRSHGEPLQYILGSEFFGDLEIKCQHGVLIPRPETAASVSHLVHRLCDQMTQPNLVNPARALRVLDLCTGTGCVPLLFHHEFYQYPASKDISLELVGVDISTRALSLARENLIHQIAQQADSTAARPRKTKSLHGMGFVHADVLHNDIESNEDKSTAIMQALQRLKSDNADPEYDILIANPPYISPKAFHRTTSPSVRRHEPKLALVPSRPSSEPDNDVADFFYPRLFQIAEQVRAKRALFEVADWEQAKRVARLAIDAGIWKAIEIWRDEPSRGSEGSESVSMGGGNVKVVGRGEGRSVFVSRHETGVLERLT